jgi:hypothetical protein
MALVKNDTGPNGKRSNFEATAAFLLPEDPVAKKRSDNKRPYAEISAVDSSAIKSGIGKTGVNLRFHTKDEYNKLTSAQKNELRQWRIDNPKNGKSQDEHVSFNIPDKKLKKMVSSAVAEEMKCNKAPDQGKGPDEKEESQIGKYLLSLVRAQVSGTEAVAEIAPEEKKAPVSLQSILKGKSARK